MLIHVLKNIEDMYPTINKRIRLILVQMRKQVWNVSNIT